MSVELDEGLPSSPTPAKAPWETPRVVESSIKDNTAYYAPSNDMVPPIS
jgi:hypothetical protein